MLEPENGQKWQFLQRQLQNHLEMCSSSMNGGLICCRQYSAYVWQQRGWVPTPNRRHIVRTWFACWWHCGFLGWKVAVPVSTSGSLESVSTRCWLLGGVRPSSADKHCLMFLFAVLSLILSPFILVLILLLPCIPYPASHCLTSTLLVPVHSSHFHLPYIFGIPFHPHSFSTVPLYVGM